MNTTVARIVSQAMYLPVAIVAGAGTVFASEGSDPDPMKSAKDAADEIGGAVEDLLSTNVIDNVKTIAIAALAVWGVLLVVRWIRRAGR